MRQNTVMDKFLMKPNSPQRIFWDVTSVLMVLYDVIAIPLLFFDFEETEATKALDMIGTIFWSTDMFFSFLTGFQTECVLEMRSREIAKHYFKGWFGFDLLLITFDWALVIASRLQESKYEVGGLVRTLRGSRIMRSLRTFRLIRFVRLSRTLHDFFQIISNEYVRLLGIVVIAFAMILLCNHYIACAWWFIGRRNMLEGYPNWIESNTMWDASNSFRYFTSLHWSLTQFTPAGMEVRPYNLEERVFSIFVLFFAMVAFSSFLGTITSTMTQVRQLYTVAAKQEYTLRQYLKDNKVSTELGQRIWRHFRHNHFRHIRTTTREFDKMKMLPDPLRKCLREELYRPYMIRLPFFFHYMVVDGPGLRDMCDEMMSDAWYQPGDNVFSEGKNADKVFFISTGVMKYFQHMDSEDPPPPLKLKAGHWAGEPCMWVDWTYCGNLTAHSTAEIIQLSVPVFHKYMENHAPQKSYQFARGYARLFYSYMESVSLAWYTDIWAKTSELRDLAHDAWEMGQSEESEVREFGKSSKFLRFSFAAVPSLRQASFETTDDVSNVPSLFRTSTSLRKLHSFCGSWHLCWKLHSCWRRAVDYCLVCCGYRQRRRSSRKSNRSSIGDRE